METMNTDTPETDGEWNRLACQDHPEFEPNRAACPRLCSDFCNAKEEANGPLDAEACFLTNAPETLAAWNGFEKGGSIVDFLKRAIALERERDEAREIL
jgi:hypothetical protein